MPAAIDEVLIGAKQMPSYVEAWMSQGYVVVVMQDN